MDYQLIYCPIFTSASRRTLSTDPKEKNPMGPDDHLIELSVPVVTMMAYSVYTKVSVAY